MFENLKANVDAKTKQKIMEKLSTPEGQQLLYTLQNTDKQQLMQLANQMGIDKMDKNTLNAALQNADVAEVLNKLRGN